jgi:hypothetical protein
MAASPLKGPKATSFLAEPMLYSISAPVNLLAAALSEVARVI